MRFSVCSFFGAAHFLFLKRKCIRIGRKEYSVGFGISDEVLEKIIMEPWLLPSEIGSGVVRFNRLNSSTSHNRNYPEKKPGNPPKNAVIKPIKTSATTKEQENAAFIKSVLSIIRQSFSDESIYKSFRSPEITRLFDEIKEYFESVFSLLKFPVDSITTSPTQEKQSKDYLFHGIADQVFFLISHDDLDKVSFRNIVNDFILLMRSWNISEVNETVKKKAFFQYYVKEFGISVSKYHCCPSCGKKLYVGISNCPSCFKNIHSSAEYSIQPHVGDVEQLPPNEKDNVDFEIFHLREQLRIAEKTIEDQKNKLFFQEKHTNELEQQNAALQKANQEKDQAIISYKHYINGVEENEHDHLKILVIGEFQLPMPEVTEIVENIGLGLSYDNFEFFDEYTKIKNLAARIKGDSKYAAIIIGAVPHKVKNLNGYSSLATLFQRDGYPFTVEARTYQGELKFTRQSFQKALTQVVGNLMASTRLL